MSTGFDIRETSATAEADLILALWRQGLTHQGVPQAKLDWFYLGSPTGAPRVFLLQAQGATGPCGTATLAMRTMSAEGADCVCGVLIDFVLHADQRTLFPALALQRAVRDAALASHDVVFGFPNPKSLAVVKRAGYRHVVDLERRVRVVRSFSYLSRILPALIARPVAALADLGRLVLLRLAHRRRAAWQLAWSEAPDDRFNALWTRCRNNAALIGVRDRAFLEWRFCRSPMGRYRFVTLALDGALVAYAVCKDEGDGLAIVDLLADPRQAGALAALMAEVVFEADRLGRASVMAIYGGDPRWSRVLAQVGFVRRDAQPVYATGTHAEGAWTRADTWYLTAADEDV
ncbi:MAG: GNAT family N-acetyltransferase [Betaproteobacteria bacterium]|nr:GNAT family N-acetyltransferase [Betaproteobacteria bacterium]